jgi:hypothetical protein
MRRVYLWCHPNILKRPLVHVAAFNLGGVLRAPAGGPFIFPALKQHSSAHPENDRFHRGLLGIRRSKPSLTSGHKQIGDDLHTQPGTLGH